MTPLSTKELLVFQTALLQANLTFAQLARQLRMREYNVRRTFESLCEKGVILGKRPYLNPAAFGFTEYLIYISLLSGNKTLRTTFVKMLCECERICLVAEVGGDYQYEVRFLARDSQDIMQFLDSLTSTFKEAIQTPAWAIIHDEEYSVTRFVTANMPKVSVFRYMPASRKVIIDEIDHKILSMIANDNLESHAEIGRRLNLPPSTVAYRIKSLEKSGLIIGYCYFCDVKPFGYNPMSLLIHSNTLSDEKRRLFFSYCQKHDGIAIAHILFGAWQAKVHVRVKNYEEALSIINQLKELLPGDIQAIRIMPQLRFYKFALYPFRNFSAVSPRMLK